MRVEGERAIRVTRRRLSSPPVIHPTASSVRVRGIPPRALGPPNSGVRIARGCSRGPGEGTRVAWRGGGREETAGSKSNARAYPEEDDEEGAIQEFYGQLWFVLGCYSTVTDLDRRVRVRDGREKVKDLVWIRRELWESKSFEIKDCYPA